LKVASLLFFSATCTLYPLGLDTPVHPCQVCQLSLPLSAFVLLRNSVLSFFLCMHFWTHFLCSERRYQPCRDICTIPSQDSPFAFFIAFPSNRISSIRYFFSPRFPPRSLSPYSPRKFLGWEGSVSLFIFSVTPVHPRFFSHCFVRSFQVISPNSL